MAGISPEYPQDLPFGPVDLYLDLELGDAGTLTYAHAEYSNNQLWFNLVFHVTTEGVDALSCAESLRQGVVISHFAAIPADTGTTIELHAVFRTENQDLLSAEEEVDMRSQLLAIEEEGFKRLVNAKRYQLKMKLISDAEFTADAVELLKADIREEFPDLHFPD